VHRTISDNAESGQHLIDLRSNRETQHMSTSTAETSSIRPSTRGLANVQFNQLDQDFEFRVGSRLYRCSSVIAEFLSPKIAKLRMLDPTIKSMQINTEDGGVRFCSGVSLGFGDEFVIDSSTRALFIDIFSELENWELCSLALREGELTVENVLEGLKVKRSMNIDESNEIKFIATHFHEFSSDAIVSLNDCELYEILSSPHLQLSSEDSLCELVTTLVKGDLSCFRYFECVRFEFLSTSTISAFVELTEDMNSSCELSLYLSGRV
jgi:hypothetical protein